MRFTRGKKLALASTAALLAVACGVEIATRGGDGSAGNDVVVGKPLTEALTSAPTPATKLKVGQDCTAFEGNTACESDLCLRFEPGFPPKGVCTVRCDPSKVDSCPDGPGAAWRCSQLFPARDGWICAPPTGRAYGVATLKGGKVPLPAAVMTSLAMTPDASVP